VVIGKSSGERDGQKMGSTISIVIEDAKAYPDLRKQGNDTRYLLYRSSAVQMLPRAAILDLFLLRNAVRGRHWSILLAAVSSLIGDVENKTRCPPGMGSDR